MFVKLKRRLGRRFRVSDFHKYYKFIELINQNDFQRQIDIIWEVLFNTGPSDGCYRLLELLLQIQSLIREN